MALDRENESGHVVLLNSVSSSGKGSIATELQKILERPYWLFSPDYYLLSFPHDRFDIREFILQTFKGFYKSVAAFADEGINIIVDTVFQDGTHDFEYVRETLPRRT